jgi:hybrid cluster-associated redox disulfide protein
VPKITKKDNLAKLVTKYPKLTETLMFKYGLHCLGCMAASFETLEEGAKAHGMTDKQIKTMVNNLNKKINN